MDIFEFMDTQYIEWADARPIISGTAATEVGKLGSQALIQFGGQNYTVDIDINGLFSWTSPVDIADGEYSLSIIIRDAAGNLSPPLLRTVIVDTTPPEAPALLNLYDDQGDVTGSFDSGKRTDDARPTLSGAAQKGSLVMLLNSDNEVIGSARADSETGVWVLEPSQDLPEGDNALHLVASEVFANVERTGSDSAVFHIVVGPDAPPEPQITYVWDDVGVTGNVPENGRTNDTRPTLHGTGLADSIIILKYTPERGAAASVTVQIGADGSWQWTPPTNLKNGGWTFEVYRSEESAHDSFALVIDPTADLSASIDFIYDNLDDLTPAGYLKNGDTTDDTTPSLSGMARAATVVNIYDDGKLIGSTLSDAKGHWSWTPSQPLANNHYEFNVAQVIDGKVTQHSENWAIDINSLKGDGTIERFDYKKAIDLKAGDTVTLSHTGLQLEVSENIWFKNNNSRIATDSNYYDKRANADSGVLQIGVGAIMRFTLPEKGHDIVLTFHNKFQNYRSSDARIKAYDEDNNEVANYELKFSPDPFGSASSVFYGRDRTENVKTIVIVGDTKNPLDILSLGWKKYPTSVQTLSDNATENYDKHAYSDEKEINTTYILHGQDQRIDASLIVKDQAEINTFDITGSGNNTLIIDVATLLQNGEQDLFIQDGKTQLMVKGDAGDVVQLKDILPEVSDISGWQYQDATITVAGIEYQIYSHGDDAELLVQQGVKTELI